MTFSNLLLSRAYRYFTAIAVVTIILSVYHTSFRHPEFSPNERHNNRPAWTIHAPWEDNELKLIPPPSKGRYEPLKTDSAFVNWVSARIPTNHVPFVTVGDCQYIHALRNFHHQLEQWGHGDDMVVICLDQCCADVQDYHSYTRYIGESVAYIKVGHSSTPLPGQAQEPFSPVLVQDKPRAHRRRLQLDLLRRRCIPNRLSQPLRHDAPPVQRHLGPADPDRPPGGPRLQHRVVLRQVDAEEHRVLPPQLRAVERDAGVGSGGHVESRVRDGARDR